MNVKLSALSSLNSDKLYRILFAIGLIWIVAVPDVLTSTFAFVSICALTVFAGYTRDTKESPFHCILSLLLSVSAFCYRVDWLHISFPYLLVEGLVGFILGAILLLVGYSIRKAS